MDFDHRRQDVDAHFGQTGISFPKNKCRIGDSGPQNGSTHAFKWDLKAKMDETMGRQHSYSAIQVSLGRQHFVEVLRFATLS